MFHFAGRVDGREMGRAFSDLFTQAILLPYTSPELINNMFNSFRSLSRHLDLFLLFCGTHFAYLCSVKPLNVQKWILVYLYPAKWEQSQWKWEDFFRLYSNIWSRKCFSHTGKTCLICFDLFLFFVFFFTGRSLQTLCGQCLAVGVIEAHCLEQFLMVLSFTAESIVCFLLLIVHTFRIRLARFEMAYCETCSWQPHFCKKKMVFNSLISRNSCWL